MVPPAHRPVRAAAPHHTAAARPGPAPARASLLRAHPPRIRRVGSARALGTASVRHDACLCRGAAARCRARRSVDRAGPAVPAGRGGAQHPDLGEVLAGSGQSLRLAGRQSGAAGAVAAAAPGAAASVELVLPHPAHLHGDGGHLSGAVPSTRHARDRIAAGGVVQRGVRRCGLRRVPQPAAGRRPLRPPRRVPPRRIRARTVVRAVRKQAPAGSLHRRTRRSHPVGAVDHRPHEHLPGQRPPQHPRPVAA